MSASEPLEIHVLEVGNGDCIIIRQGADFGVIDCNTTPTRRSPARDKLLELGAKRLKFVCLTHPDKDHYSGLLDVLVEFSGNIDFFYSFPLGDLTARKARIQDLSRRYLSFLQAQDDPEVTQRGLELIKILVRAWTEFGASDRWEELSGDFAEFSPGGFDGTTFIAIQPPKKVKGPFYEAVKTGSFGIEGSLANNTLSVAILVSRAAETILLGGDVPAANWRHFERFLERSRRFLVSSAVKLPHHGSATDCSTSALELFFAGDKRPRVGLISADGKRHPARAVLEWLLSNDVAPYCTNYFHGWTHTVRRLFRDSSLAPELQRLINEYADVDLSQKLPCCGDIKVTIGPSGAWKVDTEYQRQCGCRPAIRKLFGVAA